MLAISPIDTGMSPLPGFLCSSATMGSDSSIPATGTPGHARGRDATGTDREFQGWAVPCPPGEVDRGPQDFGCIHGGG